MGRQIRKWSSKMPIFVSFAHYVFRIFIPKAEIIIFYCVKLLHKHDKLTQCYREFTVALARLSCCGFVIERMHNKSTAEIKPMDLSHRVWDKVLDRDRERQTRISFQHNVGIVRGDYS